METWPTVDRRGMMESISNEVLDERLRQLQRETQGINARLDVLISVQERVVRMEAVQASSAEEKARMWVAINDLKKKQDDHDEWANETREEIYGRVDDQREDFKEKITKIQIEQAGFRGKVWGALWIIGIVATLFTGSAMCVVGWLANQVLDSTSVNRLQEQRLQSLESNQRAAHIIESNREDKR